MYRSGGPVDPSPSRALSRRCGAYHAEVAGSPRSDARLQPREDLASQDLDLLELVAVGNEDEAIHARRHVLPQLGHALVGTPADGVLDGRFAPGGHVPLRLEPVPHGRFRLRARTPHVDGELVGARERFGIAPGLARETEDLVPGAPVALRRVEVGQPTVPAGGRPPEHGVDVAPDQDGRARLLNRARPHHRLAQVELVDLEAHPSLRPEAREDVEVALEEPAPLLEW